MDPTNHNPKQSTHSTCPPQQINLNTQISIFSPIFPLTKQLHPTMASAAKSLVQTLKRYIKKPWEITGPVAHPEYRSALPGATEYRVFCPATIPAKAIVPTSDPETVYDIKYYTRDQRRNRPPIRRTILKKADVEKMMKEQTFDVNDFPRVYLTAKVEEDYNAIGGGYQ